MIPFRSDLGTMSLLDLPHDILICVLSDLDIPTVFKCQRVCKRK